LKFRSGNYFECPLNNGLDIQFIIRIGGIKNKNFILYYYIDVNDNFVGGNKWTPRVWWKFEEMYPDILDKVHDINNFCDNCFVFKENEKCIICSNY
jgi:hypothetical protein